jgi:hypothetical protein
MFNGVARFVRQCWAYLQAVAIGVVHKELSYQISLHLISSTDISSTNCIVHGSIVHSKTAFFNSSVLAITVYGYTSLQVAVY